MVEKVLYKGQAYYVCPRCGMAYANRDWAKKCEDFCAAHNACSLEITQHSVELPELTKG